MSPKPRARASAKKPTPAKPRAASKRQAIAKTKPPVSKQPAAPEPESIPVAPIANSKAPPHPTPAAPLTRSEAPTESVAKARKRGLGALSKHALLPVNAPLTLVTRPRPPQQTLVPSIRPSSELPEEALNYLRAELTSLLAILESSAP